MALLEHGFAVLGVLAWLAGIAWLAVACIEDEHEGPVWRIRRPFKQVVAVVFSIPWPFYLLIVLVYWIWEEVLR